MKRNQIINGDCVDVIKNMDDSSVDMVLFSPPYDKIRTYNGFSINLSELGRETMRVTKDGGICAIVMNDMTKDFCKSLTTFKLAIDWVENSGWKLFETCIYSRNGRPGCFWNQRFRVDHEYILIFFKGERPKHFDKSHMMVPTKTPNAVWHGTDRMSDGSLKKVVEAPINATKCRGTIWHYAASNTEGNIVKNKHPATFPDAIARDLVLCFTEKGDLILDPTVGSGTTAVVAKQSGRDYIGIDISSEYCLIAQERLDNETVESIL